MGSEGSQAETGDASGRGRHGVLLKLAILVGVLAPVLVFLFASLRGRSGLVAGPPLPPGKVGPQLVNTLVHAGFLLAPDGSLWCWRTTDSPNPSLVEDSLELPQRVGTDTDWCRVAASYPNGFALKTDGSLWSWGWTSVWASAKSGATYDPPEPERVGTDTDWAQIAAGGKHCLALKRDGSLWAWGQNEHGQVGNGTTNYQLVPKRIGTDMDWATIAAGDASSFALKRDGTLWAWGFAWVMGGRTRTTLNPGQIDSVGNVAAISANGSAMFAVRSDGTLWICGEDPYSVVRAYAGTPAKALFQIGKEADWKEVYAGRGFYLARKRDGSWWVSGQCKLPLRGARWRWSPPCLASPRRLALRFEPWALAPEVGDAMLLTRDGSLWTLSVLPDSSGFDLEMARLKTLVNQTLAHLPGSPEPFDEKAFRIDLRVRKLWELPPEVRN